MGLLRGIKKMKRKIIVLDTVTLYMKLFSICISPISQNNFMLGPKFKFTKELYLGYNWI
jgi:hypothetical protein